MSIIRITHVLTPALGLILACGSSAAQQETKMIPRLGIIENVGPGPRFETIRKGLDQLGYVEGRNIIIEPRFAKGDPQLIPGFVADLVRMDVDVIVSVGAVGARVAQKATTKIPIVFVGVIDPVAAGLVDSLERPGGNVTGITSFDPQQPRKQFELLKELFPKLSRVAILSDHDIPKAAADPGWNPIERANDTAARALNLEPLMHRLKGPNPDLDGVFAAMVNQRAEALVILEVPVNIPNQKRIAELAARHRLPTMFPGGWADAGGIITYGTSIFGTLPSIPQYVHKILKGAKPADLPIGVITQRELIFNLKTANAIDVAIPSELLKRADQVIE